MATRPVGTSSRPASCVAAPDGLDAHVRWVGPSLSGGPTGELDPLDDEAPVGRHLVDGHQCRLVPTGTGPGGEQHRGGAFGVIRPS